MRICYTPATLYDALYLAQAGLYTGAPLEIVRAMQRTTLFRADASLEPYLAFHRVRLIRLYGHPVVADGLTLEARAAALLEALITLGVVARWRDETPQGDIDHE
jgi:hypothetical protein